MKATNLAKSLIVGTFVLVISTSMVHAQEPYEGYYLYLGDYPSNRSPGWHEDGLQGVTHDRDHWYITGTGLLWRIPVGHDLNSVSPEDPGVSRISLSDIPALARDDFEHFGDPSYYEYGGQGYILIPIEHVPAESGPVGLAIIRADTTLEYVDHALLAQGHSHAGWSAVDPQGYVYTSDWEDISTIYKYRIEWETLRNNGQLVLSSEPASRLRDENGADTTITHLQGGVITASGRLLYLVADGIHVFDMSTWRRVQLSTNGSGYFNYEFHQGFWKYQEPEGITIWDLDDGRAPGIAGQLHVLLRDKDPPFFDDELWFKHYSGTIHVDRAHMGDEKGTPTHPFNTLSEANDRAWDGARIRIRAGTYPENLTFSKRIELLAEGGAVVIGQ